MAVYDQQVTSYSDTTAHIRVIADVIKMIDPHDTPLLAALGGLDAFRGKARIRMNGYKIEWLEDELDPLTTTANQGTTITTATLSITVTDASIFQVGHVILIDSEYMVVSGVTVSTNVITVYSRAYGGTNATHATGATITLVGMARLEGADASYGPVVDITAPYNYTSIFQKALNISGTQQVIDQYGIDNEFEYQASKAMPHLLRLVERMAFHGIRAAGTASAPRSAGGLLTFITDNSENASGVITKTFIDNLAEKVEIDGGNPDLLVAHPSIVRDLKDLIDSSSFVRVGQENDVLGMSALKRVVTQYQNLALVTSRWCPTDKAFILDSSKVGFYTLRPFGWYDLAKTGDSKKGEVVGEVSFGVLLDKSHGWVYGITT
jgi:hypothetical protein